MTISLFLYNIPEHDIQAELNCVIGDDDKSLLTIGPTKNSRLHVATIA